MGAPIPKVEAVDNGTAEALLSSLQDMAAAERRKHASVFNYWLSIKGDRQFPPIRDLDPLEISDAGPWSVLLELIGAGENAVIRHLGQAIKLGVDAETIARAPDPSLLHCIHARLPAVAATMQALAFEDSFETDSGPTRCWVTLLPFSANGTWIDYVYGFVSLGTNKADKAETPQQPVDELESFQVPLGPLDQDPDVDESGEPAVDALADAVEPEAQAEPELAPTAGFEAGPEAVAEEVAEPEPTPDTGVEPEIFEPAQETDVEPEALEAVSEPEPEPEVELETLELMPEPALEPGSEPEPLAEPTAEFEPLTDMPELEPIAALDPEPETEPLAELEDSAPPTKAGFSAKFMESVSGFYGRVVHAAPTEPAADDNFDPVGLPVTDELVEPAEETNSSNAQEPVEEPVEEALEDLVVEHNCGAEGTLQSKLTDVRAMAEEARQAQLRSQLALIAGLSAAYDFALDAESEPEEYLRLVEGQGLKIQLRAPMKPVVKLAFAETCDDATIAQLEAVLAWALKQDLPRGSLADRIEAEGGIGSILEGLGKAA